MALGNLAQRVLVALVAAPVLIFLVIYLERPEPTWALVLAASLLSMRELFGMLMPGEAAAGDRQASLVLGGLACTALYWLHPAALGVSAKTAPLFGLGPLVTLVFAVVAPALYYLFRFGAQPTVAARMTATITGIVYAGLLLTFLGLAKRDFGADGGYVVVMMLLIAWFGDTGGYFAGRFIGGAKLYPAVSPNKTWAGSIGGLAGSLLAVVLLKLVALEQLGWIDVVLIAIPGGMLGQLGDLAESLLKRSVGVKDSGALLPGHGGMLDRIDAVLFIAPYTYLYLTLRPLIAG
ncbi:MAG: phosphatidate cytidylyltransferase [Kofleriaceae bacterium]